MLGREVSGAGAVELGTDMFPESVDTYPLTSVSWAVWLWRRAKEMANP